NFSADQCVRFAESYVVEVDDCRCYGARAEEGSLAPGWRPEFPGWPRREFEFALELGQLVRELPVRGDHFAQLHECPHDVNAHLNCSRATQDGGCHDRAVLSERIGREARIPVLL